MTVGGGGVKASRTSTLPMMLVFQEKKSIFILHAVYHLNNLNQYVASIYIDDTIMNCYEAGDKTAYLSRT